MILDDNIVDKQMVEKENFDLAFCSSKHTAQAIAEALNLLDNIEGDGITLRRINENVKK